MKKLLMAALPLLALVTSGCATLGGAGPVGPSVILAAVTAAIGAETAASVRCPRGAAVTVLLVSRATFDLNFAARLSKEQAAALTAARLAADRACGFGAVPAAALTDTVLIDASD